MSTDLPHRGGTRFVTDGGMETDLIFHRGIDLPEFAAFPLVEDADGRRALRDYYTPYIEVARRAQAGLLLETGTWRASTAWGARLGYSPDRLHTVNGAFVAFLRELEAELCADLPATLVSGMVGPQGDGYRAWSDSVATARDYHRHQVTALAEAGADLAGAYTMTTTAEAIGVVRAAREVELPIAVAFTVETDGRLPDGTSVPEAVRQVEETEPADHYLLNCAHPDHVARGLALEDDVLERIIGTRVNASRLSHAELDEAEALDDGDPDDLAAAQARLRPMLGEPTVLGGCCGTDVRHVARLWNVRLDEASTVKADAT